MSEQQQLQSRIVDDPELVQSTMAPGANEICHLYRDGTITTQKGGWAYRQRSEFTRRCSIRPSPEGTFVFPPSGFIRIELETAKTLWDDIREYMITLVASR